jgi:hypothetical protein
MDQPSHVHPHLQACQLVEDQVILGSASRHAHYHPLTALQHHRLLKDVVNLRLLFQIVTTSLALLIQSTRLHPVTLRTVMPKEFKNIPPHSNVISALSGLHAHITSVLI